LSLRKCCGSSSTNCNHHMGGVESFAVLVCCRFPSRVPASPHAFVAMADTEPTVPSFDLRDNLDRLSICSDRSFDDSRLHAKPAMEVCSAGEETPGRCGEETTRHATTFPAMGRGCYIHDAATTYGPDHDQEIR